MKSLMKNRYFLEINILIISFVFIFSGIEKIANPDSFGDAISNYRLFPEFSINLIAIIFPWIELFLGFGLFFKRYTGENSFIISLFLLFFNTIIVLAIIRGLNIDCGCFGTAYAQKVGVIKLIENFVLLALSFNIFLNYENG